VGRLKAAPPTALKPASAAAAEAAGRPWRRRLPRTHGDPEGGRVTAPVLDHGQHQPGATLAKDHVARVEEALPFLRRIGRGGVYAIAKHHDLIVTNVFHAGDGNLHPLFSFDLAVPGTMDRVLAAADELVRLCVDAGGALSGEHGIGLEKRDFMPLVFTPEDLNAQACVRAAFDPGGLMNPRKVLPDGARCGEYAAAALARAGGLPEGGLPEGTWI